MPSVQTIPHNQAEHRSEAENALELFAEPLIWRIHLSAQNRRALPGVVAAIVLAALLASLLFHTLIAGAVAAVLLVGAIREFLFPMEYQISSAGVRCKFAGSILEMAWKDVRRLIVERGQITVSPLPSPGWLDTFRGVTLRFAADGQPGCRAQVYEACLKYAPTANGVELLGVPSEDRGR
jgi:hypothetical protein